MTFNATGCLPETEQLYTRRQTLKENAVNFYRIGKEPDADAPVIAWDDDFRQHLNERGKETELLQKIGHYVFPWQFSNLDYHTNQGNVGSCCGCAAGQAAMVSLLMRRWRQERISELSNDDLFNPIACYVQSHGGRLRNGQDITTMADAANTWGQYTRKDCGSGIVTRIPPNYRTCVQAAKGKRHQSAVCFIPPEAEAVRSCVKAGYAVFYGNSIIPDGGRIIDGLVHPTKQRRGSHAMGVLAYYKGLVYWANTWGKIYPFNEWSDGWGMWMNIDVLERFLKGSERYGDAVCVVQEN